MSHGSFPPPPVHKSHKEKKKKTWYDAADTARNEGEDPNWAYNPPPQYVLADHDVDCGELDWDAVRDDEDTELWLIRAPEDVKPRHIGSAALKTPSSEAHERIGTLSRHHATYDVWSIGKEDENPVGGEEMLGLSCLLPRQKKHGKLYKASKPFTRHIVISAQHPNPAPLEEMAADPLMKHQNPPRFSYPEQMLKHSFKPNGSECAHRPPPLIHYDARKEIDVDIKKQAGKKRKVYADSPKKIKKSKLTA